MKKPKYVKPQVLVIQNMYEGPMMATISATHPDYEENDDEWGQDGFGAKEGSLLDSLWGDWKKYWNETDPEFEQM